LAAEDHPLRLKRLRITPHPQKGTDLPVPRATRLPRDNQRPGRATFLRHPIACLLPVRVPRSPTSPRPKPRNQQVQMVSIPRFNMDASSGYGNINPLSIDYASRPRLRSRLTLGGLAWPRNPWSSGGRVSHPSFATHAWILTRVASTTGSPRRFSRPHDAPLPIHTPEPPTRK
jgi:hypothetical protein